MQVMTEDEQLLDVDAAEQGLVLRLAPAGKGRAEEATAAHGFQVQYRATYK